MSKSTKIQPTRPMGKPNQLLSVSKASAARAPVSADQRRAMIAEAAYYMAERRGFESGHELEDWLLAESQVESAMPGGAQPSANPRP